VRKMESRSTTLSVLGFQGGLYDRSCPFRRGAQLGRVILIGKYHLSFNHLEHQHRIGNVLSRSGVDTIVEDLRILFSGIA